MIRSLRSWTIIIVVIFITINLLYWRQNCHDPRFCAVDESYSQSYAPAFVPDPKPPPPPLGPAELALQRESHLLDHLEVNPQPLGRPNTQYPSSHKKTNLDLDEVSPTADKATYRLEAGSLKFGGTGEFWQVGVMNTLPDVLVASKNNYYDVYNHFKREYRIYSLMKWILRVHRRDVNRTTPLVMVDAGSNHGLFTLVAGASGAHCIAFEPQTHLRSVINMSARLNQISERVRILPFAVLDQFKKVAMENVEISDGGIAGISYNKDNAIITTQTIPLDALPSFDRLFPQTAAKQKSLKIPADRKKDKCLITPEDLGADYAESLDRATKADNLKLAEALSFRQPIHFLKIDVEGFEMPALHSATKLFEQGLVENAILEFGPPHRWDVTVENRASMDSTQLRRQTLQYAKQMLHRAVKEWRMDIRLLPAEGWHKTVMFMSINGVDRSEDDPEKNRVVRKLNAYDFDDLPKDNDEYELELKSVNNKITEYVDLPPKLIDAYLDSLESIGEIYLWFTKQGSDNIVLGNTD